MGLETGPAKGGGGARIKDDVARETPGNGEDSL